MSLSFRGPEAVRLSRGRRARRAQHDLPTNLRRVALALGAAGMLAVILPIWGLFGGVLAAQSLLAGDLPSVQDLGAYRAPSTILIYDRNDNLLAELNDLRYGRHISIPLNEVSPLLVQATIATEDPTFETNSGISVQGILRALVNNMGGDEETGIQGGSSITQQLVKNVLIPEEERTQRSLNRKIREVLLAVELTHAYPKDTLLEMYLNDIYYGNLAYGIEAASRNYFDKPAKDLNLAEASMLAGLPQAPGMHNPLQNPEQAKQRQRQVLTMMVRTGHITEEEADAALATPLSYKRDLTPFEAPHWVMYVRNLLTERLGERGLHKRSLKVTTSLDLGMQKKAEELVTQHIARVGRGLGASNMAMVALDPAVGEIRVMVGSVDYNNAKISGQVNMATSPRMPGSSIKPYVYLTAFMRGWNPASIVLDAPLSMRDGLGRSWNPRNATGTSYGPMPTRNALANSLNLPAIRTMMFAGVENVINTIHKMGITSLDRGAQFYGPPLALGTGEISLLDHVYGFSVFDNLGIMRGEPRRPDLIKPGYRELDPIAILWVEDTATGEVIYEPRREERQVVPAKYAFMIVDILTDNNARARVFGLNNGLHLKDRLIGAKTGTTEDNKDAWAMGFSKQIVVGTWAGNADSRRMATAAFGENTAAPPWLNFLKWYHQGKPALTWERPPDVTDAELYPSGKVSNQLRKQQRQFEDEQRAQRPRNGGAPAAPGSDRNRPDSGRAAPNSDTPNRERFRTLPRQRRLVPRDSRD